MPFVTDEVVTAAKLNMATSMAVAQSVLGTSRTFTNSTFLDLDALTGGAGSMAAVAVTVTTGTLVKVTVGCQFANTTAAAFGSLSYRISGATTLAASHNWAFVAESAAANADIGASRVSWQTVTAGVNTFECQALTSTGTQTINNVQLIVETMI